MYLLTRQQAAAAESQIVGGVAGRAETRPEKLVAKFWQPQDDNAIGDYVQSAWHEKGVAPEVVSASCCPVQRNDPVQSILVGTCCKHDA
jgi:hypothetical protein